MIIMSLLVAVLLVTGCTVKATMATTESQELTETTTLRIMAAASLTELFTEIETSYEKEHPEIDLQMSFAGSQSLATQIQEGVDADVFASANTKYMTLLIEEGLVSKDDVNVFAKNKLAIITMKSLEGLNSPYDFMTHDYKIVIADETVPVGQYTLDFLEKIEADLPGFTTSFLAQVVSKETNVKMVVSKVVLGEADAGIVYQTDLTDTNKDSVAIMSTEVEQNIVATYPIAKLTASQHDDQAQAFVDYMLSKEGRSILDKYGFDLEGL